MPETSSKDRINIDFSTLCNQCPPRLARGRSRITAQLSDNIPHGSFLLSPATVAVFKPRGRQSGLGAVASAAWRNRGRLGGTGRNLRTMPAPNRAARHHLLRPTIPPANRSRPRRRWLRLPLPRQSQRPHRALPHHHPLSTGKPRRRTLRLQMVYAAVSRWKRSDVSLSRQVNCAQEVCCRQLKCAPFS